MTDHRRKLKEDLTHRLVAMAAMGSWTQKELSLIFKLSQSQVSRILSKHHHPQQEKSK